MIKQKRTARSAPAPRTEKEKTYSAKSIAEPSIPVKYADDVSKLTSYQKSLIARMYARSHNLDELLSRLDRLKFCGAEIAAQSLKTQGYLSDEDYCYLIERYKK